MGLQISCLQNSAGSYPQTRDYQWFEQGFPIQNPDLQQQLQIQILCSRGKAWGKVFRGKIAEVG